MPAAERLSALDASFLTIESASTPMHVGWVARFEPAGERPRFEELFAHIAPRMELAPRYRQKLAGVPLGIHGPVWVDDPEYDYARHLLHAQGGDLTVLVDTILSSPLARDRPLWEIWIADELDDGAVALIGKMHHCMVDGAAVVELGNVLLDRAPDAWERQGGAPPLGPAPSGAERLGQALLERAGDMAALGLAPARVATSPTRMLGLPAASARAGRMLARTLLPPAPRSALNRAGSPARHHVRLARSLDDVRAIRRRFGVTPNDVILAACAGALRSFALGRGEAPQRLKAMVPADVRSGAEGAATGNRISFVFLELPCDEPDPVARLRAIGEATAARRREGAAEDLDIAFGLIGRTPGALQRVLAHGFAHPRVFNLTASSVAGPAVPRYLRGCRLRTVHSAIPLTAGHAVSIGAVTVDRSVCMSVYADAQTLPDADALGAALGDTLDELLAAAG